MEITTVLYIIAGVTWGSAAVFVLGIVILRIVQGVKNRGHNNYCLTGYRNIDMSEKNEDAGGDPEADAGNTRLAD